MSRGTNLLNRSKKASTAAPRQSSLKLKSDNEIDSARIDPRSKQKHEMTKSHEVATSQAKNITPPESQPPTVITTSDRAMAPAKVGGDDRKHFDVLFGYKIHNPHLNTDAQSTHITTDTDRDTVNATIHAPHTITPEILSTAAHVPQIITPEILSFMRTKIDELEEKVVYTSTQQHTSITPAPVTRSAAETQMCINGKPTTVLMDTGALTDGGIMSQHTATHFGISVRTDRRPLIKGVAATPVRATGEATVHFTIQGAAFVFDFLILPCDTKTILGLKFLRAHEATGDFKHDLLTIRKPDTVHVKFTPTEVMRHTGDIASLYSTHKRILPPLSTTAIDVATQTDSTHATTSMLFVI